MSILGGYLVVGVDDSGAPLGVAAGQTALFDEATLSAFECAPCIGGRRLLQRPPDGWLNCWPR